MNKHLLFFIILFSISRLSASTLVSGNITSSEVWTAAGSPYLIKDYAIIVVKSGATLTIMPGVEVRRETIQSGNIVVEGSLQILGKVDSLVRIDQIPITFENGAIDYDSTTKVGALLRYAIFNAAVVSVKQTSFWVESCRFIRQGALLGLQDGTGIWVDDGNGVKANIRNSYFAFGWNASFKIKTPMDELVMVGDTVFTYYNEPMKGATRTIIRKCFFSGEIESHYLHQGYCMELGPWSRYVEVTCSHFYGLRWVFNASLSSADPLRLSMINCVIDSCMNFFPDDMYTLNHDTIDIHMSNISSSLMFKPDLADTTKSPKSVVDVRVNYWNSKDTAAILYSYFDYSIHVDSIRFLKVLPFLNNAPANCGPSIIYNSREEFVKHDFVAYPNPFQRDLRLQNLPVGAKNIQLRNMQGALLATWPSASENEALNLPDLRAGLYLLSLQNKSGQTLSAVVVRQ